MSMTMNEISDRSPEPAPSRHLDLEALARMDVASLDVLYRAARAPTSVDGLAGHPRGRMLSVRRLDAGLRAAAVQRLAAATFFPWGGKSFSGVGEAGHGANRVHLGGRHQLFPFHTRVAPSVIDGRPSIHLDYERRDNPAFIRAIHDEVREVDGGLYLGPAMWKSANGPVLVLWFGLDTRVQAMPIGAA